MAENAGGPHCLKYGVTTNHVRRARGRAAATARSCGSAAPHGEPWGPDLVGLFVGQRGNVRRRDSRSPSGSSPLPDERADPAGRFRRRCAAASEAVSAIIASGIVPAALEMMDQSCVARSRRRSTPRAIRPTPPPSCWSSWTAAPTRWRRRGRSCEPHPQRARRARGAERAPRRRSAHDSGRDARRRSARWDASRATSSVQDAVVPRSALPDVLDRIARDRATATGSWSATSSTPGTATCIPTSASTAATPALVERVRRRRAGRSWRSASPRAAASPESTASGSDKLDYMPLIFDADDARRDVRRAPGVRSRRARQSRQGDSDARLPGVAAPGRRASRR